MWKGLAVKLSRDAEPWRKKMKNEANYWNENCYLWSVEKDFEMAEIMSWLEYDTLVDDWGISKKKAKITMLWTFTGKCGWKKNSSEITKFWNLKIQKKAIFVYLHEP